MDPFFKRRLVGAMVIASLATIFLPMLFEDSDIDSEFHDFDIPEIPVDFKQEPSEIMPSTSGSEAAVLAQNSVSSAEGANGVSGQLDQKGNGRLTAWVIQVGSFNKAENANRLRDKLRNAGFPAYVESGNGITPTLFRVRVGPELDQDRVRIQRDQISTKFSIKAIVVSYP
jgi:DedD protein